jgi:hypothetical protein
MLLPLSFSFCVDKAPVWDQYFGQLSWGKSFSWRTFLARLPRRRLRGSELIPILLGRRHP